MKYIIIILWALYFVKTSAQQISGTELLERAIQYHDPNNEWISFQGILSITMKTPDQKERISDIVIDLPKQYFKLTAIKEGVRLDQTLDKGKCTLALNGSSTFSDEDAKTHRLTCERANMMKDYYTYLYGLPMKLKDPGTIIDPNVQTKIFKDKEYLVLKVSYDEEVGKDTWYFYFDPGTYAMEGYQFFHDESKNDGEYIVLDGIEEVSTIKMPKTRAWYFNKDNTYLGTDVLTKGTSL
ncbi:hypothetical protein FK220_013785 [Flavobacteriaceae bacterium TP-CH-4]|uniref:Uncharacterized protein n=1 Tax=Pelagihabitans pacificus TaxID=2696054 RepID=A0A967E793_9FLAO|nr:DUF6503 family protein [Pelagihabitans pacificus]NHF60420.1 hypothetical protein [Pelagihabitans pacificus]